MIRARKIAVEQITADAASGLERAWGRIAEIERDLAAATETEWRLCWWSSLAGCGLTLAALWLGGLL